MALNQTNLRLTGYVGALGSTAVRQWTYVDSGTTIAGMTAAAFFGARGSSTGDSSLIANDLVLCIGSNGVAWRYISDATNGTVATLG